MHYWNSTLEDLKQQSILAHNLWKSVGSPRSGDSFNLNLFTKQYNLVPCEGFHANAP